MVTNLACLYASQAQQSYEVADTITVLQMTKLKPGGLVGQRW